jgi:glycosyltransferase involved in cell wall biosynthesis
VHVVQLSCHVDPLGRPPAALLDAWPTLRRVAAGSRGNGYEVTVVQAASADVSLERDGVRFEFVREDAAGGARTRLGTWAAPMTRRAVDRVRDLRPDIVHAHGLSFPRHLVRLRRSIPSVPVLAQDHADHPPPAWRRRMARAALRGIAGVSFTARSQARPFVDAAVLHEDVPVYEVLESSSDFTCGDATVARSATGLYGDPCLLWLGHLDHNKDPLTVLEGFAIATADLPDARLWCCWQRAPLEPIVRDRVDRDVRLRERVHLLGTRPHSEVESMLRAADFFVQGSHTEGSGYAVIEALACGVTPIVTDIPALRRITRDGAVGRLAPPGDATAIARAIVAASDPDRAAQRRAARAHFDRHLSFEVIGEDLRAAYDEILGRV